MDYLPEPDIFHDVFGHVPLHADPAFADFLQEEASFGSIKSPAQLQAEILAKAKEMDIPVTRDNMSVKRTRESITVEAHYEITIDFFNGAYKYVWKFDPVFARPIFNV